MEGKIMHSIVSDVYECISQTNNIEKEDFISLCESEKLFIDLNSSFYLDESSTKLHTETKTTKKDIEKDIENKKIIGYKCKCGKLPNNKAFYTNKKWLVKHINDKGPDGHKIIEIYN